MRPDDHRALRAFCIAHVGKSVLWAAEDLLSLYMLVVLLKVPPLAAGGIFLATSGWNAALDWIWGWLLAHHARLRRVVPAIVTVAIPIACASFALLPYCTGSLTLAALSILVFRTSFSLFDVPHNAASAALAGRYGHLQIARLRTIGSFASTLLVGLAMLRILSQGSDAIPVARLMMAVLAGVALIALLPLAGLLAQQRAPAGPVPVVAPEQAARNAGILRFCLIQMVGFSAIGAFSKAVLHIHAPPWLPGAGPTIMLIMQIVGTILWMPVNHRGNSTLALKSGYGLIGLTMLSFPLLALQGFVLAGLLLLGVGIGGVLLSAWLRLSELCAGRTDAPRSFGLFTATSKIGLGLAGMMTASWLAGLGAGSGLPVGTLWPLSALGAAGCAAAILFNVHDQPEGTGHRRSPAR
jgi:GPH family glycoside/pentoside/hexuronide:cation symporter